MAAADAWSKVVVFLGSTRQSRLGDRVTKFIIRKLEEKNVEVLLVDPLKFDLPLLTQPIHFYKPPDHPPQKLLDMNEKIKEADAIVVVSAEYNHSIPPALSNTIDYFPPSTFADKPSAIVTYSLSVVGGARAAMQLRCFLSILGCVSIPHIMTVGKAHTSLDEDGNPQETEEGSHLNSSCAKLIGGLEWWANAAKHQRNLSHTTSF